MNNQKRFWIITILAVGALWFLFHESPVSTSLQQEPLTNAAEVTSPPTQGSTDDSAVQTRSSAVTNADSSNTNITTDIAVKYRQGLIGKGEVMQAVLLEENKKDLDIYGKIVDQHGEPVVGAKVRGSIGLNVSMVQSGGELCYTETDSQGRFNFIGIHGAGIGIWPQKEGFLYDPKLPSSRPEDYSPDPSNPLTFVMWKLKGAEPMKYTAVESRIPYDGTTAGFDLRTVRKMANGGGDLRITLLRSPLQIAPGLLRPYDWQVKIELLNGGIIEENDPYPDWATEGGYRPFFEVSMNSTNVPWEADFRRNFYIKNAQGQYGLMLIELSTSSKRPDTGIKVETWINPSGSQNLEFDPTKQVE